MPHRLKSSFIATFTEGANDPAKRTSLEEWLEILTLYGKEIDKDWHEVAITPSEPKPKKYHGNNRSISQSASHC